MHPLSWTSCCTSPARVMFWMPRRQTTTGPTRRWGQPHQGFSGAWPPHGAALSTKPSAPVCGIDTMWASTQSARAVHFSHLLYCKTQMVGTPAASSKQAVDSSSTANSNAYSCHVANALLALLRWPSTSTACVHQELLLRLLTPVCRWPSCALPKAACP